MDQDLMVPGNSGFLLDEYIHLFKGIIQFKVITLFGVKIFTKIGSFFFFDNMHLHQANILQEASTNVETVPNYKSLDSLHMVKYSHKNNWSVER